MLLELSMILENSTKDIRVSPAEFDWKNRHKTPRICANGAKLAVIIED